MDDIILIDHDDCETGTADKLSVHYKGILHRAVSVYIFNNNGDLLLQQRALEKYHSGGLWSNTCCTHPFPGESNLSAANRRLMEEMGIKCSLSKLLKIYYNVSVGGKLKEHEISHVFYGISDAKPVLNNTEVMNYKYSSLQSLTSDIKLNNHCYSSWFNYCFPYVQNSIISQCK